MDGTMPNINFSLSETTESLSFPVSTASVFNNTTNVTSTVTTAAPYEVTAHDILYKLGISLVIFGAVFLCAVAFILALWYTKQKIKSTLNRQQSSRNYTYDNQVDIFHASETSDTIALEKAFGTGVLVIQESPIVRQRERLTTGTGTGPTIRSGYMSTAESDTEQFHDIV